MPGGGCCGAGCGCGGAGCDCCGAGCGCGGAGCSCGGADCGCCGVEDCAGGAFQLEGGKSACARPPASGTRTEMTTSCAMHRIVHSSDRGCSGCWPRNSSRCGAWRSTEGRALTGLTVV